MRKSKIVLCYNFASIFKRRIIINEVIRFVISEICHPRCILLAVPITFGKVR